MKKLSPALVRQLFVIIIILFLLILIFREIIPYLGGVLGAITFYVLLRKWMVILLRKGWNENLASGLLMLGSFVGILVPISLIIIMLTSKIGKAVDNSERVIEAVKTQVDKWEISVGYDLSSQIDTSKIASWIGDNLKKSCWWYF
jgi:predicted PurR-regulated permease PerM